MGQPLVQQDSVPEVEDRVVLPSVEILAYTQTQNSMLEDYPTSFTNESWDGEHLIEFAGRSCYQSFHNPKNRTTTEYIKNIIAQKHFSVLEHTSVTFYMQGVSRSFTHELIRHRHLSFSQLSQRYVDSTHPNYVCPPLYRENKQLFYSWLNIIRLTEKQIPPLLFWTEVQNSQLQRKQIREAVRSVLPNCVETKITVTGNLRAWREFLEKRWNNHAEAEIAEVAGLVANKLVAMYPSVFEDITYGDN